MLHSVSLRFLLPALLLGALLSGCDSAGSDESPFFVAFTKQVRINETGSQLACNGNPEYSIGQPTYIATFEEVDDAVSYTGRILRMDDSYAASMPLTRLNDLGNGRLEYTIGVGSIFLFITCSQSEATTEQQRRLDAMDDIGHQGVEITPVF
ncbi:MAG: hypothetical protein AAF170_06930 [Bacteroidota bacterium]